MEGFYEQLKNRIEELKNVSEDVYFTEYLQKLNNRLIQEKYQLDLIKSELERSYQMYLKRMEQTNTEVTDVECHKFVSEGQPDSLKQRLEDVPRTESIPLAQQPVYGMGQGTDEMQKVKKSKEFTVGIGVFSFVGVFFVLAAFVMLGMYFVDGLVKGLLLYAMAVAVWMISELFVRKINNVLSVTFSSIGIAGLYIATLVNYLYLQNFNELIAGIVLIALTLLVFMVNRKKSLGIIQMASVAISTWVLMLNESVAYTPEIAGREIYLVVYFVLSMLLTEAMLCRLSKVQGTNLLLYIAYGFSMFTCAIGCNLVVRNHIHKEMIRIIVLVAVVVMGVLFFSMLRKEKTRWTQLFFVYGMALLLMIFHEATIMVAVVLTLLLLFVKLLPQTLPVELCNIGITVLSVFFIIENVGEIHSYIVFVAMLLSILLIRYWKACYEIIITLTTILLVLLKVPSVLIVPVILAVLWLGVVLFNQVDYFRGKEILAYNIVVLFCAALCYLWLIVEDYSGMRILYLILSLLGLGIIGFIFQEKNKLENARGLMIVVFLTYMILISRFGLDISTSVLLMLLGLGSIGAGFALTDKKLRIYGLVLSMLICFKITLFDFRGEDLLQKMLLFLVAGVVFLAISGIYIVLDKKYNK